MHSHTVFKIVFSKLLFMRKLMGKLENAIIYANIMFKLFHFERDVFTMVASGVFLLFEWIFVKRLLN
jgi:hypothetical protein